MESNEILKQLSRLGANVRLSAKETVYYVDRPDPDDDDDDPTAYHDPSFSEYEGMVIRNVFGSPYSLQLRDSLFSDGSSVYLDVAYERNGRLEFPEDSCTLVLFINKATHSVERYPGRPELELIHDQELDEHVIADLRLNVDHERCMRLSSVYLFEPNDQVRDIERIGCEDLVFAEVDGIPVIVLNGVVILALTPAGIIINRALIFVHRFEDGADQYAFQSIYEAQVLDVDQQWVR